MLGRRPAFQHSQCDTLALGPFGAFGLGDAIALLQLPLDDIEAFVEQIPFDETRLYVKKVVLSWDEYRRIYGSP